MQEYNQQEVDKVKNYKYSNLEVRTTEFAKRVIRLCKLLPQNTINHCYISQIIRSSGSVGANYREANDAISKKDFVHRLRIARKEAKETSFWLELIEDADPTVSGLTIKLQQEAIELRKILSAIIHKSSVASLERV